METSSSAIKHALSNPDSPESLFKKTILEATSIEPIDQLVYDLVSKGWTRKRFYDTCLYINHYESLPEEDYDKIGNFVDRLTGFLDRDNIIRLPGDPEDEDTFLNYVYSDWWKD